MTELIGRSVRSRRAISLRVFVLAALVAGRFARGDDADDFFMADHVYDEKQLITFGIADGSLAGFIRTRRPAARS
ncbi:MAG: hypothetical protein V9E93_20050 [Steroidobacteraceae bacterium]